MYNKSMIKSIYHVFVFIKVTIRHINDRKPYLNLLNMQISKKIFWILGKTGKYAWDIFDHAVLKNSGGLAHALIS